MKTALDVHRLLLSHDVHHEILRLPRVVLQSDEIPEVLGVDPEQGVSVRVYVAGGRFVAVAIPCGREPELTALLRAIGTRTLRSATAQEINESTDYAAGLVAPLLLPRDMPLYADARLGRHDIVYTATGETGTALGIATADLLVTSGARVANLSSSLADMSVQLEV
jgi:prolyl-tRNA editing enzyme YbaK/EbsC (Cys-tRNA(Pro) deacylase)